MTFGRRGIFFRRPRRRPFRCKEAQLGSSGGIRTITRDGHRGRIGGKRGEKERLLASDRDGEDPRADMRFGGG